MNKKRRKISDSEKKRLTDIMDNFDFEKVHNVMILMDWKVFDTGDVRIPSVEELKNRAYGLVHDCILYGIRKNKNYEVGTGGLKVIYNKIDDVMNLLFFITESDDSYITESVGYKRLLKIEKILKENPTN